MVIVWSDDFYFYAPPDVYKAQHVNSTVLRSRWRYMNVFHCSITQLCRTTEIQNIKRYSILKHKRLLMNELICFSVYLHLYKQLKFWKKENRKREIFNHETSYSLQPQADFIELFPRKLSALCDGLDPPNVCTPIYTYTYFSFHFPSQRSRDAGTMTNMQVALFTRGITNSKYFPDARKYVCLSESESGFRCEFYICLLPIRHG